MFNKSYDRYASYILGEDLVKHNTISKQTSNAKAIQVEDLHEFKSYDELQSNIDSQPIISKCFKNVPKGIRKRPVTGKARAKHHFKSEFARTREKLSEEMRAPKDKFLETRDGVTKGFRNNQHT